ncbi:MAG TPA: YceI family protein [Streptosporangiaceae bacterium]|jgi:polyisoprenoid-binding protein YceI
MPLPRPRRPLRAIIAAVIVLVVLAVGGPFVYIHLFNKAPAALSLPSSSSGSSGASSSGASSSGAGLAGGWTITSGSVVGYRVSEVLLGQNTTAVGRSSAVTGHLTITGTDVTAASFSVPLDTIHSDKSQRDAQFDGRIMNVAQYPTGTFTLTGPIDLNTVPAAGTAKDYTAHGDLTLHGTTKPVTFTLQAELKNGRIEAVGDIPVLFSDYNIQSPSLAGFVTTQDHGTLEFLLVLTRS